MSALASKALMCVCAGAVGAASVPVANKVRSFVKPRPAVARSMNKPAMQAKPAVQQARVYDPSCMEPGVAARLANIGAQPVNKSADLAMADLSGFTTVADVDEMSMVVPAIFSRQALLGPNPQLRSLPFANGAGGPLNNTPSTAEPTIPVVDVPGLVSGVVPEPGTWILLVGGFGAVGIAVRNQRRHRPAV